MERQPQNQSPDPQDQSAPTSLPSEPAAARSSAGNDDIARRAHRKFEERGYQHGRDLDDWLEAERERMSLPETNE